MAPDIIAFIVIGSFATFCIVGMMLLLIDSEKKFNEKNNNR
tara:strand:+ start:375 stop:497 length:123 start_codon:yes stop_codon:yes gene_type:complete